MAIDGDYFDRTTGTPNGMLMQNGVLQSPPGTGRSSLGIAADGTLTTGRVSFAGIWQGKAIRRPLLLNSPAGSGKFSLYTPVYGGATPRESGVVEAVIGKLPAARLETPLDGTVTQVTTSGPTPIPPGGAVLVARGAQSTAQLKAEAPVGQQVEALLSLSPDWRNLASAIGGGPLLVRKGKPIFHAGESFASRQLNSRQARGAIGQLSDGRIVLVGVEGPNPAYSIGMSNYELAVELARLGATIAYGLGAGSAVGNRVRRQAADTALGPRRAEGLRRARPLVQRRLRGASVEPCALAERRRRRRHRGVLLSRRPALGRGGDARAARAARRSRSGTGCSRAGCTPLGWNGTAGGSPAPEGTWTFTVTGTDDRKVTTTAQRAFSLDDTLSSLALTLDSHGLPTATFKLTRAATVLVQIQRPNGIAVATLRSGPQPAGTEQVTWNGRIGRHRASGGHYQLAVQATSSIGTSSLAAPFSMPKRH